MKIVLQTLTGKTEWTMEVKETDTIGDMKVMLQGREVEERAFLVSPLTCLFRESSLGSKSLCLVARIWTIQRQSRFCACQMIRSFIL